MVMGWGGDHDEIRALIRKTPENLLFLFAM